MADTMFNKLFKLFASDVIVRRIGKSSVKIVDVDSIQKITRNYVSDKYTRMYSALNYGGIGYRANHVTQRLMLFRDYEVMDTDPIIASALDVYSDESTMKNEMGDIIRIKAGSEKVTKVLHNLFHDILNVEFNLWSWTRGMCKYGDFFLQLEIADQYGVVNIMPLPPYDVTRIEGQDPLHPSQVKFNIEGSAGKLELENFQVAHFRLISDTNFLPYGKAMIEPARRVWKQLVLMEDAMLIHRIMRAPEKRVFKIDIGNIAPAEIDTHMNKIISQIKKVPFMDPDTGEYNLKFNMQNMTEDFYLPVRGGDSGTEIDSLSGLEYNAIDDIEYLRNKMMASLKIPKAFLGYEEEVGSKATLAAEDVRFARTIERIQKILVSELSKIAIVHLFVQGFDGSDLVDFSLELTTPSIIYEQEKIELWNSKASLARDIQDLKMLSKEWIYTNIFNMTDEESNKEGLVVVEDQKMAYRLEQIEQEGNDPAESQQGFNQGQEGFGENKDYNLNYEGEENKYYEPVDPAKDGRKGIKARTRKKDDPFGEDPIGQKDYGKILKLDKSLNYDANKNKHLQRRRTKAAKEMFVKKKTLLGESDFKELKQSDFKELKQLKNYFIEPEESSSKEIKENK